jgi:diguanylate cyclase (GGDEF)-like protein/PAS domain S-box-containing protein
MGLVAVTCLILLGLDLLGFIPKPQNELLQSRIRRCESLATQATAAAGRNELAQIRTALGTAVQRNEDMLSAGLRAPDGHLLVVAGDHRAHWRPESTDRSTLTHVQVAVLRHGKSWGTIEIRFEDPPATTFLTALWDRPLVRLLLLVATVGFVAYLLYLKRTLRHLDPSAVVPARVRAVLDVMAEGILLIDQNDEVVLANRAFGERIGRSPDSLIGVKASTLGWRQQDASELPRALPWVEVIQDSRASMSIPLLLQSESGLREFTVNASPVLDGWGRAKGAIATFNDVTDLEQKRRELEEVLAELEKSRDEVGLQNEELRTLATSDPLTGVSNRRTFMERFEAQFSAAKREGISLCCVMADIDHFKRVNDEHGHLVGDEVIRQVAEALAAEMRSTDAVCRYGGEEFCILLPAVSIDGAVRAAERARKKMQAPGFTRVPITVSFGVASISDGARGVSEMIDQADQALYASKQAGRNRVTHWDEQDGLVS